MESPVSQKSRILIVDDNEEICHALSLLLKRHNFATETASDGDVALARILQSPPAAMILDSRMERVGGVSLLVRLRELELSVPTVMLTGHPEIADAVKAIKLGAGDYLIKPFDHQELLRLVTRLVRSAPAKAQLTRREDALEPAAALLREMGPSRHVQELCAAVMRVAKTGFSVLLVGETGVGKELLARSIHAASPRVKGPFVAVDCGALSESLFENELFGHEKGSFTGATEKAAGRFEAANGGTLFLDEVSNLPASTQPKLLRALEQRAVCRLGAVRPVPVDVRIVAATNTAPEALLRAGRFRTDLFYRLNEFVLRVPALRERREDIPYLANRFLGLANAELGKNIAGFSERALELLREYQWPGNVRQLRHTVRQAALTALDLIEESHLAIRRAPGAPPAPRCQPQWNGLPLREVVRQHLISVERRVLAEALRSAAGNKAQAARMLQIDYKTIHHKLKEYGLFSKDGEGSAYE